MGNDFLRAYYRHLGRILVYIELKTKAFGYNSVQLKDLERSCCIYIVYQSAHMSFNSFIKPRGCVEATNISKIYRNKQHIVL